MADIYGDATSNAITGTSARDGIYGLEGHDTLVGIGGNDRLYGNAGDDVLRGGDGLDILKGARGADQLFGEAADDTLHGGAGGDQLTGGAGADTFLFREDDVDGSNDSIYDFVSGEDAIHLGALEVTSVGTSFSGQAGQVAIAWNGLLALGLVQFDADGDRVADLTIVTLPPVGAGDIVI